MSQSSGSSTELHVMCLVNLNLGYLESLCLRIIYVLFNQFSIMFNFC